MTEDTNTCLGVFNDLSECNFMYGGERYILTDRDIELLKQGKIINFSVNDEYGCTLQYRGS